MVIGAMTAITGSREQCRLETTRDCITVVFPIGYSKRRALDEVWHAIWAVQWSFFVPPNDLGWEPASVSPSQLSIDSPWAATEDDYVVGSVLRHLSPGRNTI